MTSTTENTEGELVLPLATQARIVAVSGKLVALEKPEGVMTHPNREADRKHSLLRAAYNHEHEYYKWESTGPGDPGQLFLLNRIDSPTSGLVMAALDLETALAGRRAFAQGKVEKAYYALVLGQPRPSKQTWTDRLSKMPSRGHGVRMAVSKIGGGPSVMAQTRYESIETHTHEGALVTLLRLEPLTGRTHQLRVQCAAHRHAIIGDGTYGEFQFNREFAKRTGFKRLFLHAASTRIPGLKFYAESPIPREFYTAMGQ